VVNNDLAFLTVRELGHRIKSRQLSPVDLTEMYLARLETIGPKLGAVVTVTRSLAIEQAATAEKEIKAGHYRGPLHGIPYGVKDAFSAKGFPTTWGSAPYKDRVFDYDSTVVTMLREAGAILIGKLAMVELVGGMGYDGADASFTGPGRTPWNPEFWSGGSSSGPGAATSAGLVAFSIGGETGGSILSPSNNCGLTGMRTTYGRVSRAGGVTLSWTLDKVGPMCRSADDCGLVLAAIAGYDPLDPATTHIPFVYDAPATAKKRYRIGIVKGSYDAVQPEVRANFEQSLKVLADFADLTHDVVFPDYPYAAILSTVMGAEAGAAFRELIDTGQMREMANEQDRINGYARMMISAVDYLQATRVRRPARMAMDKLLAQYDAVIGPTSGAVAGSVHGTFAGRGDSTKPTESSTPRTVALTGPGNVVGVPAISVPNGFGQNNLPTGMQFMGPAWSEKTLIDIAVEYQKRTDWHKRNPPIDEWMKSGKSSLQENFSTLAG
jgi:aspartyl-tRNA(Asn)/glutamyl-tRNA(Gln) amidotransferase subunit A